MEGWGEGWGEGWVGEVEAVEDLVVVVAWGFAGVAGEFCGVGAFEVDDAAVLLVHEGVVDWVVEGVGRVGGDLDGFGEWAVGGAGFGEPDFAEEGGIVFGAGGDADEEEAVAEGVPADAGTVDEDGVGGGRVGDLESGAGGGEFSGDNERGLFLLGGGRVEALPDP